VLERQIKGESQADSTHSKSSGAAVQLGGQCPECGGLLVYQEGCQLCHSCGYTKCS